MSVKPDTVCAIAGGVFGGFVAVVGIVAVVVIRQRVPGGAR